MANLEAKLKENVQGKYYTDDSCICCGTCVSIAPDHFVEDGDGNYAYVYKQPSTVEEIEKCELAVNNCPMESIGNNGDDND